MMCVLSPSQACSWALHKLTWALRESTTPSPAQQNKTVFVPWKVDVLRTWTWQIQKTAYSLKLNGRNLEIKSLCADSLSFPSPMFQELQLKVSHIPGELPGLTSMCLCRRVLCVLCGEASSVLHCPPWFSETIGWHSVRSDPMTCLSCGRHRACGHWVLMTEWMLQISLISSLIDFHY